ncbi:glucosamine-6-phosphate deaminase [Pseudarthrobacter sp. J75]|uniref:glucosamine-6-phosphate deaminase n=1 Tax=unclassified Pseudarthrobacter TaxID=2647000 RepID=UPI002E805E0A|nr:MULTISPECIES: glucosamine-6-phosphate deaminase [unclassified Pseudarthrobacter]MEE2523148.1 glucosamine-6-phosphate deaminase [Pseudarthrobacter sp. J47]MEE2529832.1 glucosamine-6-phosphate deaminase [Pseudarthrobacter sp. J75]
MKIAIFETSEEIGAYAADIIERRLGSGRLKVLGVATGSSPLPVYRELAARKPDGLSGLSAFALDEYVGLSPSHPESYRAVIDREVTVPLGLDPKRVHVPDGSAENLEDACTIYEERIKAFGGIDIQLLGIGSTGHIGFNEPTSSLSSRTRIKTLTPETRRDNARFFASPDEVPTHCLTQGLGTIMDAREVILVAQGSSKAKAIAGLVEGPLSAMCPGSVLQMHQHATILVDEEAAAELQGTEYYKYVTANLPAWQR